MKDSTNHAMQLLAAADPAPSRQAVGSIEQDALVQRILADDPAASPTRRPRIPSRRVAIGASLVAVTAAVAVAGVVVAPWNHGHATSAAYAVVRRDDAVQVTVHFDELHDPAALNAELQAADARTVVMAQSAPGECHTGVVGDPAHTQPLSLHEAGRDPAQQRADLEQARAAANPWIITDGTTQDQDGYELFTVHPQLIPAGDQLLVYDNLARPTNPDGTPSTTESAEFSSLLVPELPACVPAAEDSIITNAGISVR